MWNPGLSRPKPRSGKRIRTSAPPKDDDRLRARDRWAGRGLVWRTDTHLESVRACVVDWGVEKPIFFVAIRTLFALEARSSQTPARRQIASAMATGVRRYDFIVFKTSGASNENAQFILRGCNICKKSTVLRGFFAEEDKTERIQAFHSGRKSKLNPPYADDDVHRVVVSPNRRTLCEWGIHGISAIPPMRQIHGPAANPPTRRKEEESYADIRKIRESSSDSYYSILSRPK